MPRVRVHNVAVSLDGSVAGPGQDANNPLGVGGTRLHDWVFATRTGRRMLHLEGEGQSGLDDDFVAQGDIGIGATVIGRNMFGPIRGPWGDDPWSGWWGDEPPYHHPVFVLTHHPRPPLSMRGGIAFHFVDDGIEAAVGRARAAADGQDVRIGGGASVIQQYRRAGLIDEMHVPIVPILLGRGERLFDNLDGGPVGSECVELVCSSAVGHARFTRTT
jgi:dihydrofolate reductase